MKSGFIMEEKVKTYYVFVDANGNEVGPAFVDAGTALESADGWPLLAGATLYKYTVIRCEYGSG